jgi:hypothetical protein
MNAWLERSIELTSTFDESCTNLLFIFGGGGLRQK